MVSNSSSVKGKKGKVVAIIAVALALVAGAGVAVGCTHATSSSGTDVSKDDEKKSMKLTNLSDIDAVVVLDSGEVLTIPAGADVYVTQGFTYSAEAYAFSAGTAYKFNGEAWVAV